MDRLLISADSHVSEPIDLWTANLPEHLRAQGPRMAMHDGAPCLMVENMVARRLGALNAPDASGADDPQRAGADALHAPEDDHPKTFAPGASDPAQRLKDLDRDGVWAEVIYPNLGFVCCFRIANPELQIACAKVYNDWVADCFIGASERFAPVALLPVLDVDAAVAELRRAARRGFRGVLMPAHLDSRPYNDPAYEKLWAAAADLAMPLTFHAGTGRTQTPAHGGGAAVINYVVVVSGPMETVAYLCGAGILERHPNLRVVMVECGSGWLAWALHAMDDAYREHNLWARPKLKMLPSEYFRRQGAVTFQNDPVGLANLRFTGERCLMWGSDYPHPEGTWPNSRKLLARQLAGLDEATIRRITCDNAAELYRVSLPPVAAADS
jgi:predicted TIM-barrel fold metal-dependent hydrolase